MMVNCQAGDKNCAKVQECKRNLETYISEMKKANVKAFIWMGYPVVLYAKDSL